MGRQDGGAPCVCENMKTTGESPSPGVACSAREPEGYCVAARRGGELLEGNDPSPTVILMTVNSIRLARRTSLRSSGEVFVARHTFSPETPRYTGLNAAGEWVEGEGSEVVMEQTKRPAPVLEGSGAGVRVAIVAVKRVTTVEPRAAGR